MKLHNIIIKNLKYNIKKYISFLCACIFVITVMFTFFSMLDNESFELAVHNRNIYFLLNFALIVLSLFMVFFINYVIVSFLKAKSKEYAIYMMLGIEKSKLFKIIIIEFFAIILFSLISGLILGNISAFITFIIFFKVFALENIQYSMKISSYINTIGLFSIVIIINMLVIFLHVKRLELIDIMKQFKKPESFRKSNSIIEGIFTAVGLMLIIFSFMKLFNYMQDFKEYNSNKKDIVMFILLIFIGLLVFIGNIGNFIMDFSKKNKKFYYSRILSISEIGYKYNQSKKIIFSSTILGILAVIFTGSAYSLFMEAPRITDRSQPYHLVYPLVESSNIKKDTINELLLSENVEIVNEESLNFIYGKVDDGFETIEMSIISEEGYNKLTKGNLDISKGEMNFLNMDQAAKKSERYPYNNIKIQFNEKSYEYKFSDVELDLIINLKVQPYLKMVILDIEDFNKLRKNIDINSFGTFYMFDFKDWQNSYSAIEELYKYTKEKGYDNEMSNVLDLKPMSKIEFLINIKQECALRLFIIGYLGVLFLVCMGSVLYFKMINEIDLLKEKYKKLVSIGITKKEFNKIINSELKVIFYSPFILSGVIGYLFIKTITTDSIVENTFPKDTLIILIIYLIFQSLYYLITKYKYKKEILN